MERMKTTDRSRGKQRWTGHLRPLSKNAVRLVENFFEERKEKVGNE